MDTRTITTDDGDIDNNDVDDQRRRPTTSSETSSVEDNEFEDQSFSDPDDFVDDDGIESDAAYVKLLKTKPVLEDKFPNVVIVDNIPVIGEDRLDKLNGALGKILSKYGKVDKIKIPVSNGYTKGYMYVKFTDESSAGQTRQQLDGHRLDKSHRFAVNTMKEFDHYMAVKEETEWEPPKLPAFVDAPDLLSWMSEPNAVDQYCILHDFNTITMSVYSNTVPKPTEIVTRGGWTEKFFVWSPMGTYIASCHQRGIVVWGGSSFDRISRIAHQNVSIVLFSPCERFVITCGTPHRSATGGFVMTVNIHDIATNVPRRSFSHELLPSSSCSINSSSQPTSGPDQGPMMNGGCAISDKADIDLSSLKNPFKWSQDGEYFARLGAQDTLSVYSSKTFALLDKKSIRLSAIMDFEWAPSLINMLALWQAERTDTPARMSVIAFPGRDEIRGNNLFNVADCKIFWQNKGHYVCFQLNRYIKQKLKDDMDKPKYLNVYHNFEIFHVKEKNCPIDSMELKSRCLQFSWEPNGHRFAVVHETGKLKATFYRVTSNGVEELKDLNIDASDVIWSPTGSFLVLANLKTKLSHRLYFMDGSDLSIMNEDDCIKIDSIEWDPTGRYICTSNNFNSGAMDNRYTIWSFQGRQLLDVPFKHFIQFTWRPRHPSILPDEKVKEIKKNIKTYSKAFEDMDKDTATKLNVEQCETRIRALEEFTKLKKMNIERLDRQKQDRLSLRRGAMANEYTEEIMEFLLCIDEETIKV